jgi:hypothetical protein
MKKNREGKNSFYSDFSHRRAKRKKFVRNTATDGRHAIYKMYVQFSSDRVDMALILRYPQITKSTGPVVAVAVCTCVSHSSLYIP